MLHVVSGKEVVANPDQEAMLTDLERSGLTPTDIGCRPLENPERAATQTAFSTNGYIIPYFDIQGRPLAYYRVRLFDNDPKYKQPKDSANHIYFPKGFGKILQYGKHPYIVIAEGEKKAALGVKLGLPTCSVSGVDNWRNRIIKLPKDSELSDQGKNLRAKLPSGTEVEDDAFSPNALGFAELVDFAVQTKRYIIIAFDTDEYGIKSAVQRAAAQLGYELRFRGVAFTHVRQLVLPRKEGEKTGLDDYLMEHGLEGFNGLLTALLARKSAFPLHPNIREYLNKQLQRQRISRKELMGISLAILSNLDATGIRLRSSKSLHSYYFDGVSKKLLRVEFPTASDKVAESTFGQYLYRRFGVSAADQRLNIWLGAQFTAEDPVGDATPFKVFARRSTEEDSVLYQLGDSHYAEVIGDYPGLKIHHNGENGILFESDQVKPVDLQKLVEAYETQYKDMRDANDTIQCWWADVLQDARLRDRDKQRIITALLFYVSPWLYRWRGIQLPVEMALGEAGSGKSTLYALRLLMQSGNPALRNAPQDIKDWWASAANTGGLHVTDNLQLADRNMRQRLSDEICRLVTEPDPSVEQRKYYTNMDLMKVPVSCVFAITAIQQPFLNADILQRGIVIEFDKTIAMSQDGAIKFDAEWANRQMQRYGGRESWLAHHILVLHKFFGLVKKRWNYRYPAQHRLTNFEQTMMVMAEVFGINSAWIPNYLANTTNRAITISDWALEGIQAFCQQAVAAGMTEKRWTAHDIAEWASQGDNIEYMDCDMLTNSRKLGRYIQAHKTQVASACGLMEEGTYGNRICYKVVKR